MWLLSFLPTGFLELIINAVLIGSIIGIVLGFFGSKLPVVGTHANIIKYVSIALFCVGLYWKGGFSVEKEWRERVEAMEVKVKQAEAQAKEQAGLQATLAGKKAGTQAGRYQLRKTKCTMYTWANVMKRWSARYEPLEILL